MHVAAGVRIAARLVGCASREDGVRHVLRGVFNVAKRPQSPGRTKKQVATSCTSEQNAE